MDCHGYTVETYSLGRAHAVARGGGTAGGGAAQFVKLAARLMAAGLFLAGSGAAVSGERLCFGSPVGACCEDRWFWSCAGCLLAALLCLVGSGANGDGAALIGGEWRDWWRRGSASAPWREHAVRIESSGAARLVVVAALLCLVGSWGKGHPRRGSTWHHMRDSLIQRQGPGRNER